jgi:hypothetical protein
MWELAERVARTEKNRGVLKFFANYFLNRTVHADPPRIEELALLIQSREFNRADEATRSLSEEIGNIIALLWISHGREVSRQMLEKWIADPHAHEAELGRAIFISRDALVLRYRSTEACDEGITRRAQDFCAWTVNAMAEGLERYLDMVRQTEPTEAERERGARYAKLLGEMTNQIYFASGAFRSGEREETLLDSVEAKRAFLADMSTVLARVAEVGTPDTIYHLIELLGYLTPANPALVFDLVARALLGGGKRHNFQFESLGADRFVEIVGLFLADHRELFSADERRRKDLVSCLEVFTEAGWPAARRLLYRLPELLR